MRPATHGERRWRPRSLRRRLVIWVSAISSVAGIWSFATGYWMRRIAVEEVALGMRTVSVPLETVWTPPNEPT